MSGNTDTSVQWPETVCRCDLLSEKLRIYPGGRDAAVARRWRTALESGYRLIDTASFYGNEREVGEGVRASGVPREEIVVQTKLYPNQYSHAARAIEACLSKLDLGYIDILLLHHPASNDVSAYRAIEQAIRNGKVRSAGISCYYIKETDAFLPKVEVEPEVVSEWIKKPKLTTPFCGATKTPDPKEDTTNYTPTQM